MTYGYKVKKTGSDWQLYDETATKWMPRRERRKATAKARQREQQRLLASLSMAAGIFAYPYGLSEAAIVDNDVLKRNEVVSFQDYCINQR